MSRYRNYFDARDSINEPGGSDVDVKVGCSDEEFAQLTKVKSAPHERLSRVLPGKARLPVSPVKMLAGRECNYSGRGKFSLSDSCHVLSRYLPIHGPTVFDKMKSCAYVSQFSADGSLFVAGFQVLRMIMLYFQRSICNYSIFMTNIPCILNRKAILEYTMSIWDGKFIKTFVREA